MYIKRLSAINMGPINDVSITFPFDESENPKPVIIVGENGTGKTTLLSNVVDSLYELAEKAFNDVTKSDGGSGHQYFKAISPSEIQIGKEYMCSIIEYTCPRNPTYSIGYVMKCGSISADLIKSGNSFCANKKISWKDTEGYKKAFIEKSEAETIFGRSVFCYFGPDRYEKPAWMGKRYYQQDEDIHPSIRERWQGQLRKPITVHDVNEQTLQWLLDIIADSRCDIVQKGDQLLVEHIDMGSLLLQGTARRNVENIMTEASNPVPTPLLGHRCRSSQEITGSPTPFSTSNHCLWICASASFSLSNPNIAA